MVSTPISPSRQNSVSFPVPQAAPKNATSSQLPTRRQLHHPDFEPLVQFLSQPLVPLVGCYSGQAPAEFPETLLAYNLLTHEQLDNLARFFQQTSPATQETAFYPAPMERPWVGARAEKGVSLDTKRRRFGRFIGLRGCDSPTVEHGPFFDEPLQMDFQASTPPTGLDESMLSCIISEILADSEQSVHMIEDMEYEWQAALMQAQAEQCHSYGLK